MPSTIAKRIAAGLTVAVLLAGPAAAHGAFVDVASVEAVGIAARYDTGEIMASAQVSVFAPDNPAEPWLTGVTDAQGRFVFMPDDRPGRWAIQVREAGHGAMGYVEVGASEADSVILTSSAGSGTSLAQRLLMVACVLWGCVGTALYFRRSGPRRTV